MAKGIIVVDIPERCNDCIFSGYRAEPLNDFLFCRVLMQGLINESCNRKPDWCPIRVLPEIAHHEDYCDNGRYDKGWNDCLNEIEGKI